MEPLDEDYELLSVYAKVTNEFRLVRMARDRYVEAMEDPTSGKDSDS